MNKFYLNLLLIKMLLKIYANNFKELMHIFLGAPITN